MATQPPNGADAAGLRTHLRSTVRLQVSPASTTDTRLSRAQCQGGEGVGGGERHPWTLPTGCQEHPSCDHHNCLLTSVPESPKGEAHCPKMHGSSPGNGGETTCQCEMQRQPPVSAPKTEEAERRDRAREKCKRFFATWSGRKSLGTTRVPRRWGKSFSGGAGVGAAKAVSLSASCGPFFPTVHTRPDGL